MEGLDKGWNMVGKQRAANYTNVPPGDYTFRVKGTNSDGIWNEQGVALKIIIPPPFWQTTWFRVIAALAVIGGISGVFLLRIRSIEKQRQQLETQVDERTRELRQTMLALESAKDAAETANRAKSTFLANMSHELRTPLNAILGFTQVMARDKRLPPEQLENVAIVQRSSEHLLGLINDVLEVSKIEAGRTSLNPRNFDLHHLLEGLQEMFALRAENKGIVLQMVLAPDVPRYVNGDEGKLRQILMNLLGNAVKFTSQGQVVLGVQAPEPPQGRQVQVIFSVEDSGPGISPQEMELLFLPFVQTSSGQESQEGTGLGLSISQQYVHLMGGAIRVSSELGAGSRFEFEVPFQTVSLADLEKPPLTRRVVSLEPGQPAYRLLVVDDQEVNRKLLVKIFQPLGFEIRQAANGAEALEVWQSWSPHLIWMDMRMPVMDGYEATRRIKATTQGMATIIIALTASALEEDRQVILSEGCDDYMRKPFVENDLLEAAARHLGVRYIYEDILPVDSTTGKAGPTPAPQDGYLELLAHLQAADPAWISSLERATILGDLDEIDHLASQIEEQDQELADGIASLADRFEHEQILALIKRSRNPDEYATY
jgi:two-component system sensor histidine kinase/response regulator